MEGWGGLGTYMGSQASFWYAPGFTFGFMIPRRIFLALKLSVE